jgi:short-subunit dehydrogenase
MYPVVLLIETFNQSATDFRHQASSYLLSFTESLQGENKDNNARVTILKDPSLTARARHTTRDKRLETHASYQLRGMPYS